MFQLSDTDAPQARIVITSIPDQGIIPLASILLHTVPRGSGPVRFTSINLRTLRTLGGFVLFNVVVARGLTLIYLSPIWPIAIGVSGVNPFNAAAIAGPDEARGALGISTAIAGATLPKDLFVREGDIIRLDLAGNPSLAGTTITSIIEFMEANE